MTYRYILIFCFLWTGGQQIIAQSEIQLSKKANGLFAKNEYSLAIDSYRQLLSNNLKNIDYNYRYAVCLFHTENPRSSEKYFNYLIEQRDCPIEVYYYKGRLAHLNYQFDIAIELYSNYVSLKGKKSQDFGTLDKIKRCQNAQSLLQSPRAIQVVHRETRSSQDYFAAYLFDSLNYKLYTLEDYFKKTNQRNSFSPKYIFKRGMKYRFFSTYSNDDNAKKDIFYQLKNSSNDWEDPQRLSNEINTRFNEDFPFYDENSGYLYFSSEGHNSMGGYDLFRVKISLKTFEGTDLENLNFPYSSTANDFLFIPNLPSENIFFTTDRNQDIGAVQIVEARFNAPVMSSLVASLYFKDEIDAQNLDATFFIENRISKEKFGPYKTNTKGEVYFIVPAPGEYIVEAEVRGSEKTFENIIDIPPHVENFEFEVNVNYKLKDSKEVVQYRQNLIQTSDMVVDIESIELNELAKLVVNTKTIDALIDAELAEASRPWSAIETQSKIDELVDLELELEDRIRQKIMLTENVNELFVKNQLVDKNIDVILAKAKVQPKVQADSLNRIFHDLLLDRKVVVSTLLKQRAYNEQMNELTELKELYSDIKDLTSQAERFQKQGIEDSLMYVLKAPLPEQYSELSLFSPIEEIRNYVAIQEADQNLLQGQFDAIQKTIRGEMRNKASQSKSLLTSSSIDEWNTISDSIHRTDLRLKRLRDETIAISDKIEVIEGQLIYAREGLLNITLIDADGNDLENELQEFDMPIDEDKYASEALFINDQIQEFNDLTNLSELHNEERERIVTSLFKNDTKDSILLSSEYSHLQELTARTQQESFNSEQTLESLITDSETIIESLSQNKTDELVENNTAVISNQQTFIESHEENVNNIESDAKQNISKVASEASEENSSAVLTETSSGSIEQSSNTTTVQQNSSLESESSNVLANNQTSINPKAPMSSDSEIREISSTSEDREEEGLSQTEPFVSNTMLNQETEAAQQSEQKIPKDTDANTNIETSTLSSVSVQESSQDFTEDNVPSSSIENAIVSSEGGSQNERLEVESQASNTFNSEEASVVESEVALSATGTNSIEQSSNTMTVQKNTSIETQQIENEIQTIDRKESSLSQIEPLASNSSVQQSEQNKAQITNSSQDLSSSVQEATKTVADKTPTLNSDDNSIVVPEGNLQSQITSTEAEVLNSDNSELLNETVSKQMESTQERKEANEESNLVIANEEVIERANNKERASEAIDIESIVSIETASPGDLEQSSNKKVNQEAEAAQQSQGNIAQNTLSNTNTQLGADSTVSVQEESKAATENIPRSNSEGNLQSQISSTEAEVLITSNPEALNEGISIEMESKPSLEEANEESSLALVNEENINASKSKDSTNEKLTNTVTSSSSSGVLIASSELKESSESLNQTTPESNSSNLSIGRLESQLDTFQFTGADRENSDFSQSVKLLTALVLDAELEVNEGILDVKPTKRKNIIRAQNAEREKKERLKYYQNELGLEIASQRVESKYQRLKSMLPGIQFETIENLRAQLLEIEIKEQDLTQRLLQATSQNEINMLRKLIEADQTRKGIIQEELEEMRFFNENKLLVEKRTVSDQEIQMLLQSEAYLTYVERRQRLQDANQLLNGLTALNRKTMIAFENSLRNTVQSKGLTENQKRQVKALRQLQQAIIYLEEEVKLRTSSLVDDMYASQFEYLYQSEFNPSISLKSAQSLASIQTIDEILSGSIQVSSQNNSRNSSSNDANVTSKGTKTSQSASINSSEQTSDLPSVDGREAIVKGQANMTRKVSEEKSGELDGYSTNWLYEDEVTNPFNTKNNSLVSSQGYKEWVAQLEKELQAEGVLEIIDPLKVIESMNYKTYVQDRILADRIVNELVFVSSKTDKDIKNKAPNEVVIGSDVTQSSNLKSQDSRKETTDFVEKQKMYLLQQKLEKVVRRLSSEDSSTVYEAILNEQFSVIPSNIMSGLEKSLRSLDLVDYSNIELIQSDFTVLNDNVVSKNKEVFGVDEANPSGLNFRVQVGAFRRPVRQNVYREFTPVSGQKLDNGLIVYMAGYFNNSNAAVSARKEIRGFGYNDAFIVAYCNNERLAFWKGKEYERNGTCMSDGSVNFIVNREVVSDQEKDNENGKGVDAGSKSTEVANSNASNEFNNITQTSSQANAINPKDNRSSNPNNPNDKTATFLPEKEIQAGRSVGGIDVSGIFYAVQVGAFNRKIRGSELSLIRELDFYESNGLYRYSSGKFQSIDDARVRKIEVVSNGISDAFIVVFYNGKRITMQEARDLIDAKGGAVLYQKPSQNIETNELQYQAVESNSNTLQSVIKRTVKKAQALQPSIIKQMKTVENKNTLNIIDLQKIEKEAFVIFSLRSDSLDKNSIERLNRVGIFHYSKDSSKICSQVFRVRDINSILSFYVNGMEVESFSEENQELYSVNIGNSIDGEIGNWLLRNRRAVSFSKKGEDLYMNIYFSSLEEKELIVSELKKLLK